MSGIIRIYSAISMDGFLAGENDDLTWLDDADPPPEGAPDTLSFAELMDMTGALLMGRRTFDVVQGFGVDWPYGELPVLVATHRPLTDAPPTVRPASGDIRALCRQAQDAANGADVYLDGGDLITQALDADLVDEMILTLVPTLLGKGIALYQGDARPRMAIARAAPLGDTLQIKYVRRG